VVLVTDVPSGDTIEQISSTSTQIYTDIEYYIVCFVKFAKLVLQAMTITHQWRRIGSVVNFAKAVEVLIKAKD
jgi:hypothetical protein